MRALAKSSRQAYQSNTLREYARARLTGRQPDSTGASLPSPPVNFHASSGTKSDTRSPVELVAVGIASQAQAIAKMEQQSRKTNAKSKSILQAIWKMVAALGKFTAKLCMHGFSMASTSERMMIVAGFVYVFRTQLHLLARIGGGAALNAIWPLLHRFDRLYGRWWRGLALMGLARVGSAAALSSRAAALASSAIVHPNAAVVAPVGRLGQAAMATMQAPRGAVLCYNGATLWCCKSGIGKLPNTFDASQLVVTVPLVMTKVCFTLVAQICTL